MGDVPMYSLGWRMKQAEHLYRRTVPADDYLLLRLDGRAFHSYTRGLTRPFDTDLMAAMDATMQALCTEIDGARLGYCQSDEISLVVTNWQAVVPSESNPDGVRRSAPWLGGVESKLLSVAASFATVTFNDKRVTQGHKDGAQFDARLWTFPAAQPEEVLNYLLWRQRDCIKNSVTMAAQAKFSHRMLEGVNTDEKRARLAAVGQPWEDLPVGFQRGRVCVRRPQSAVVAYFDKRVQRMRETMVDRQPFTVSTAPEMGAWVFDHVPGGT